MSESEDITIDILERCISQSEKCIWRCVKSSRESGEDKNELGCGIRPKMNVSDLIFGCFGNRKYKYPRARNSYDTAVVAKAN